MYSIFIILAAVFFSAFMIRKPHTMVHAFFLSMPIISVFYYVKVGGYSVIDLFYASFMAIGALVLVLRPRQMNHIRKEILLIGVMLFTYVYPYLINSGHSIIFIAEMLSKAGFGLLIFMIVGIFYDSHKSGNIVSIIYISVLLFLVAAVVQLISGVGVGEAKYSQVLGFYADEGTLSRAASYGVILSLPILNDTSWKANRIFLRYVVLAFSLFLLGVSISRNAILATGMVFVYYLVSVRKIFYGILMLLTALIIYIQLPSVGEGLTAKLSREISYFRGDNVNIEYLGSGRVGRWIHVGNYILKQDLLRQLLGTGQTYGPHGQFLEVILRSGILGAILIFGYYIRMTYLAFTRFGNAAPDLRFYLVAFLVYFWVMCFAATPLYNFYLQSVIFSLFASLVLQEQRTLGNSNIRNIHP
jgi:hypothetical protein